MENSVCKISYLRVKNNWLRNPWFTLVDEFNVNLTMHVHQHDNMKRRENWRDALKNITVLKIYA